MIKLNRLKLILIACFCICFSTNAQQTNYVVLSGIPSMNADVPKIFPMIYSGVLTLDCPNEGDSLKSKFESYFLNKFKYLGASSLIVYVTTYNTKSEAEKGLANAIAGALNNVFNGKEYKDASDFSYTCKSQPKQKEQ